MFIRQRDLTINPLLNLPPGGAYLFQANLREGGGGL